MRNLFWWLLTRFGSIGSFTPKPLIVLASFKAGARMLPGVDARVKILPVCKVYIKKLPSVEIP